jgi:hypothetical protein
MQKLELILIKRWRAFVNVAQDLEVPVKWSMGKEIQRRSVEKYLTLRREAI